MGYDLEPSNKKADWFHFGALSWPVLLEACGYLWPAIQNGGQWYCVFGVDKRMPKGHTYPEIITNDGFRVTAEEGRIMARVARNFVAIQRSLPEVRGPGDEWPVAIRDDFVDKFDAFATWAEKARGFRIH